MLYRKIPDNETTSFKVKSGMYYWSEELRRNRKLIVAEENKIAIAVISYLESSFYDSDYIGVGIVTVHPLYQATGLVRGLIQCLFKEAVRLKKGIRISFYTDDGELKIRHIFEEYSKTYQVKINH